MAQAGISSAPGTSGDGVPLPGAAADPAERARYEREVAALDLSDAEFVEAELMVRALT